ncbi:D-alanyl-D-alanine carboxypeptidase family protein [Thomasclavelia cocleata]|uniref:serine-type D-Ala-D-Ala carboxypeptidase n=1 Tax=Thomasclavelia cocleata TaxID=69824 RepID=A0A1I0DIP8_9FIRM|nr:D-alanyl-D-alanine carboxypeptidase family protein [Thomasclavelia cocleata]MCR1961144.1 D-alanyl-D-alanine carboxypeptidase [Thomasclavelia cocleata]SET32131.1 D-alanyl-D-alanine carboxypeptidase (penicillin-binding protein 5/6) [Thomasclavelia cocleata]
MIKKIFITLIVVCLLPITNVKALDNDVTPNARAAILIEANSKQVLYDKNSSEKLYPASTTKIMTMILMFEAIRDKKLSFEDKITTSKYAASMGGSQVYLEQGESMSLKDMFKSIAIASANDASVAVAEHIAGSIDKFVTMMNDKAKELNLKNTHFKNATGLHDDDHYTCAHDLALMAAYLIQIGGEDLLNVTSLYDSYIREDTKQSFWLVNTNKLLKLYDGVDGLKTGYTKEAGYCLVTTVKRNNQRIIGVLMKESAPKTRNEEMCSMLDYGFNNYKQEIIFKKDTVIEKHVIDKMENLTIDVKCKQDIAFTTAKNSNDKYTTEIIYKDDLLPIKKGDVVGTLIVTIDGKEAGSYELYSDNDANKATYFSKLFKTFKSLF